MHCFLQFLEECGWSSMNGLTVHWSITGLFLNRLFTVTFSIIVYVITLSVTIDDTVLWCHTALSIVPIQVLHHWKPLEFSYSVFVIEYTVHVPQCMYIILMWVWHSICSGDLNIFFMNKWSCVVLSNHASLPCHLRAMKNLPIFYVSNCNQWWDASFVTVFDPASD